MTLCPLTTGVVIVVASALFWDLFDEYILWSLLVGLLTFGWLFHHSFWYVSSEGEEYNNPDKIEVGVFPRHNDDMKLEVAWTILPFILIVYLTYISWAPLDAVWTSADGGLHGDECVQGQSSNNYLDSSSGAVVSECYHIIEITGKQWVWSFNCNPNDDAWRGDVIPDRGYELGTDICDVGTIAIEGYGMQPLLSLKAGETYLAVMQSEDVTHAPWVQVLGVKEDVLPSQKTTLWLPMNEVGESMILCTEYCGDAHSIMSAGVFVHN